MEVVTDEQHLGILGRLVNFFVVNQDPRTKDWFLSGSFYPLATILASYLYFCLYAGPAWMKNRKPFELKNTLIVYNVVQVILSIYLVVEGLEGGWRKHYNFTCQLVDYTDNPLAIRVSSIICALCMCILKLNLNHFQMASAVWVYYMCKLIELLDTVFFVLRKKQNQITFLHLYHHTMMPFAAFIGTKYLAGK